MPQKYGYRSEGGDRESGQHWGIRGGPDTSGFRRNGRKMKGRLLDEVVAVTDCHRKSAIRLLGATDSRSSRHRRVGRPRVYGPAVAAAAGVVWEASG